jgi:hypothetical protein
MSADDSSYDQTGPVVVRCPRQSTGFRLSWVQSGQLSAEPTARAARLAGRLENEMKGLIRLVLVPLFGFPTCGLS